VAGGWRVAVAICIAIARVAFTVVIAHASIAAGTAFARLW